MLLIVLGWLTGWRLTGNGGEFANTYDTSPQGLSMARFAAPYLLSRRARAGYGSVRVCDRLAHAQRSAARIRGRLD